jgi:DNA-binding transcriptional LysR family regulator
MPLRFTLRQLEYFVAVGEAGSIAKAAEQVNVSPPAISAAISHLETEFATQLFIRKHSHALSLTAAGRVFLKEVAQLLVNAEALHDVASDLAHKVRGLLTVGCLLTFAPLVVPPVRAGFEELYPDVRFRQFERNHSQLMEMLQRGEIDVALTYDLGLLQDIVFEPLMKLPPYVVLSPAHRLAGKDRVSPEELVEEPLILLDLPYSREYFLSIFTNVGLRPNIVERTTDITVMRAMVANGLGYGIANIRPLAIHSADGKALAYKALHTKTRPLVMGVALPTAEHRSLIIRAFIDHCRKFVAEQDVFGTVLNDAPGSDAKIPPGF